MRLVAVCGAGIIVAIAGCSSAPSVDKTQSTTAAIQGGTTDTKDSYAVGVCAGAGPGQCQGICSGALIAPNLVMTARHCTTQAPSPIDCTTSKFGAMFGPPSIFFITTNYQMFQQTKGWHSVSKIVVPTSSTFCGNDMALLILKDNVPSTEAVPITPVVQYSISDHSRYSTTVVAIGFGNTGPSSGGSGTRRIKQNINLICIPGDSVIDCGTSTQITPNEFASGDGTCSGDSGSSAYEQTNWTKGSPISFGVLSRGGEDSSNCLGGIYTRTDAYKDLIVATAIEAATAGGYTPPAWTQPPVVDGGAKLGFGETCGDNTDCASNICDSLDGENYICTQGCDIDAQDCPDGFVCTDTPKGPLCFPPPPVEDAGADGGRIIKKAGGCAIVDPHTPVPWKAGAILFGLFLIARRRRYG